MTTIRLTVAQAIVRYLSVQFTERDGDVQKLFAGMFGIFGHGNVTGMGQALGEYRDDLRYYRAQNEQAMVHTAVAYAKMNDRKSTFACTSSVGPGATNMITGAALATVNRLPVLLLPGDTFANRLPHPVLQQLEYPLGQDVSVNDAFRPVSRYWDRIMRPEQLLSSLPEAMRVLTDPVETGAVTIALPEDVQTEAYDFPLEFFEQRIWRIRRPVPETVDIEEAARWIDEATRPLIIAGGGAIYSGSSDVLGAFATEHAIPVSETQAGKGVLPWDHPWNLGPVGANGGSAANTYARDADLVIAIGTRLADFTTASKSAFQHPDVRFIGINVSPMDAHKLRSLPVIGDARTTVELLSPRLSTAAGSQRLANIGDHVRNLSSGWRQSVDELRLVQVEDEDLLTQANVIGVVNDWSQPRDVVVCAAGGLPGDLLRLWRASDPKGYHVEYGFSCMGYEIAGGLGVKLADPTREAIVMVGDGSYLMLHTEIVTSIQEGIKLTIVLLDNSGFQCIRGLQMSSGSPSFGNELRSRNRETGVLDGAPVPVDFVANARSLGAAAFEANTASELEAALIRSRNETRTTLIYVPVDSEVRIPSFDGWWDVPIAEVSSEPTVQQARDAYVEDRKRQRRFV